MRQQITFVVYGEPVAKGRPRFFRRGPYVGVYTPDKTRNAETGMYFQASAAKPAKPWEGAVRMVIAVYKSIPKSWSKDKASKAELGYIQPVTKPDWDNYGKLVSDALNGLYYRDDSQVVEVQVVKKYSTEPRTVVVVEGDDEVEK